MPVKKAAITLVLAFALGLLGALIYRHFFPTEETQPLTQQSAIPEKQPVPSVRHPVPDSPPAATEADEKTTVALEEENEESVRSVLSRLFDLKNPERFFLTDNFIQRFVATVDSLPKKELPLRILPVRPVPGQFLVKKDGQTLSIHPDNAQRYLPYLRLLEGLDLKSATEIYVRSYPRFQEAYRNLGYPQGYFNDRFIEVIGHLLETPDPAAPIDLVRPVVFYDYADPALQERSAGQKMLMRTGPENAARIKARLTEWRSALANLSPGT